MATFAQVKHQKINEKICTTPQSLMDRYANGSLTLVECFIEISKTIGKRKTSSDTNINSAENLP